MIIKETSIKGCKLIKPTLHQDERGFFCEVMNLKQLEEGLNRSITFVQDNHSHSKKQVLRGLHYQEGQPQAKLIQVIQGTIFDVCVDLRPNSPTFKQWIGIRLSGKSPTLLWIPEGLAHGFLVLSASCDFIYKTTAYYAPLFEKCLRWDDPDLAINWPNTTLPLLSKKDQQGSFLKDIF